MSDHLGSTRPSFRRHRDVSDVPSRPMRLLIVDDNARVRRMIAEMTGPLATDVIECSDGSQALHAYLLHRPDVVLMDISMGGQDGVAAAVQIIAADPDARVVMVTDYDGVELREAAQAAGVRGYVLKENLFELRSLLEHLAPPIGRDLVFPAVPC